MTRWFLLILLTSSLGANAARACAECGGKGIDALWLAREREPRASQLHPQAPIVEYTLDISEQTLSPAGKAVRALAVNRTVPGPVLRFRKGDVARVHVRNRLAREEASIHWHGLLVPNLEDGVPELTTPPVRAGESRTFEFLIKQTGTYWYHSHTGLQEQRGVYGAIVIEPKAGTARPDIPRIDREEVLVLSDWTNEKANDVMRTLLRGSDWYAIRKGTAQSVAGAVKAGRLKEFLNREKSRMPPMDVSDVAYDAFLINGKQRNSLAAKPGETIRLRMVNAAASTYFYLNAATGPLTLIAADGIDIAPIRQNRLLIGMAETYDVLVTIPPEGAGAWELRATSQDGSGYASLFLGEGRGSEHAAPALQALDVYSMNEAMAAVLDEMDEPGSVTDEQALREERGRPLPPYKRLRAVNPTTLPAEAPVREVTLKLTGDMLRYSWSIDGKSIDEQSTVPVKKGEVLRLVLVNNTMMHHPMHLHGHFFRLLMPDGVDPAFAPLKHTVDVPPMSRRVIEFYANEDRDWLFHCHLLYHMKAGMARVVSYPAGEAMSSSRESGGTERYRPHLGEHGHAHTYAWIDGSVQTQMSEGRLTMQRGRDNLYLDWETGWERVESFQYETALTYARYLNPRWSVFGGYRLTDIPGAQDAVIAGVSYQLPYRVDFSVTIQSSGDVRGTLARTIPLTALLGLLVRAEYDTDQHFSWMSGLGCTLTKRFSVIASYDSDFGAGAGIGFRF